MIHKKYRILILILICIMLFNSMIQPEKVKAEAITMSVGLMAFLMGLSAVGVSQLGNMPVNVLTPESVKLYEEWQEFINKKPPEEKPPHDWAKTAILTSLGLQVGDKFIDLVNSIKGFFQSLGAKEGENIISDVFIDLDNDYDTNKIELNNVRVYYDSNKKLNHNVAVFKSRNKLINLVIEEDYLYFYIDGKKSSGYLHSFGPYSYNPNSIYIINFSFLMKWEGDTRVRLSFSNQLYQDGVFKNTRSSQLYGPLISDLSDYSEPLDIPGIIYYITNNSYILNDTPPPSTSYPSPNIIPSNLPREKLSTVTLPDAKQQTVYTGTPDDLIEDLIKNPDPNNLFKPTPSKLTELSPGKILIEEDADLPYPDTGAEPEPDTVPNGLAKIIELLKQIINWESKIYDKMGEKIDPEPQPEPEPKPDPLENREVSLDIDKLRKERQWSLKFPFSIPWDLSKVIRLFARSPEQPDLKIDINNDYLKINYSINLDTIGLPIRFFRYVATAFFIFWLASKTRDVIKW